MSPKTLQAMAKSPIGRRSSSGSGLRPVLPFGLDDGSAIPEDIDLPTGPVPRTGTFAEGEGVDEVEVGILLGITIRRLIVLYPSIYMENSLR
jgi:hypothetical protein